jgi:hypothetical protein
VLERRADESNLTRAFAVRARTLELLDARGIADDLVATRSRDRARRRGGGVAPARRRRRGRRARAGRQHQHARAANATGDAFAFVAPFGDGWYRVIAWNRQRQPTSTRGAWMARSRASMRRRPRRGALVQALLHLDPQPHGPTLPRHQWLAFGARLRGGLPRG